LLTGVVVYGTALGGLFALTFAFAYQRIGRLGARGTAALLAAAGFVSLFLVPQFKYPSTPLSWPTGRFHRSSEAAPLKQEIVLPEVRLITQAERELLRETANIVCTKVLVPAWKDKNGKTARLIEGSGRRVELEPEPSL
jgi:Probable cobalt transporter subunit (CbtA)